MGFLGKEDKRQRSDDQQERSRNADGTGPETVGKSAGRRADHGDHDRSGQTQQSRECGRAAADGLYIQRKERGSAHHKRKSDEKQCGGVFDRSIAKKAQFQQRGFEQ